MMHRESHPYTIIEQIHESELSQVYRATDTAAGRPVILKVLNADVKDASALTRSLRRYEREYEILKRLDFPEAIRAYDFISLRRTHAIVLEDFGGDSLRRIIARKTRLPVGQVLELGSRIAAQLGMLHQRNILHKDIHPGNLVWNANTGTVKIIDFGIAATFGQEATEMESPMAMEGTLAYMAPEQTGRMNRGIDYRADYYGLGATFYELLLGVPPFVASDALELIHAHLARRPEPLHLCDPAIPEMVSHIVTKLLAKAAEERYQSAHGLIADLERCRAELEESGTVPAFDLATKDFSERLKISAKLYGRAGQVAVLRDAFSRTVGGSREAVLIAGPGGAGKTSIVRELFRPITRERGLFIAGKFDELQREVPYSAIAAAFRRAVRQILAEEEVAIERWRKSLTSALSPNGQLMVELIPDLLGLLGPQPPLSEVPALQAEDRFWRTFQRFLRAFCSEEHPVVLFLDDLQWADASSRTLLRRSFSDPELTHFLFVGAYRDDVGEKAVPVLELFTAAEAGGLLCQRMEVGSLGIEEVRALVADTLHTTPAEAASLAELIADKTRGNPFFIGQFLRALADRGALRVDPRGARWVWDLDAVAAASSTDNVVELALARLRSLPELTQRVLRTAALLGSWFALDLVAEAMQMRPSEAAAALEPAIAEGVVVARAPRPLADGSALAQFGFVHDRLREASYQLIGKAEREAEHLRVGRILQSSLDPEGRTGALFDIVAHLNQGRVLIDDASERRALAEMNLIAGERALAAQAVDAAAEHLGRVMAEVIERGWDRHDDLAYRAALSLARAEIRRGRLEAGKSVLDELLTHVRDPLAQVEIYYLLIELHSTRAELAQALALGLTALAQLGVELPEAKDAGAAIMPLFQECLARLGDRPLSVLAEVPVATDPGVIAAYRIMEAILPAAFFSSLELYVVLGLTCMRRILTHGVHGVAAFGPVIAGVFLVKLGRIAQGVEAGQVSLVIAERFSGITQLGGCCFTYGSWIGVWQRPLREVAGVFARGLEASKVAGNRELITYNMTLGGVHRLLAGAPLTEIEEVFWQTLRYARDYGIQMTIRSSKTVLASVANLLGKTADASSWDVPEDGIVGAELRPDLEAVKNLWGVCLGEQLCALVHLLYGDAERASRILIGVESLLPHIGTTALLCTHELYTGVALALCCHQAGEGEGAALAEGDRAAHIARIEAAQAKLAGWAAHCPSNFGHMARWLEAELSWLRGDWAAAVTGFEAAIDSARDEGFVHHEGMLQERLIALWLERRRPEYARPHIAQARACFRRWGAVRKLERFERAFAGQRRESRETRRRAMLLQDTVEETATVEEHGGLDFRSILKASQSIVGELDLGRLLGTLMRVLFESAGAQRGTLFLVRDGALLVEAEGEASRPEDVVLRPSIPLSAWTGGARSVVSYVHRTESSAVVGHAGEDERFQRDPYIAGREARSILCMPLIGRGSLVGVLYLENELTYHAFSERRLWVLDVLAGQIAVALDNARLYEELNRALHAARDSERLKSEFLAMASHELKTPLNIILNVPKLLRDHIGEVELASCSACGQQFELDSEGGDALIEATLCPSCGSRGLTGDRELTWQMAPEEALPLLGSAVEGGERLLAIVDSLIEVSHLDSGQVTPALELVDIAALYQRVMAGAPSLASAKHISLGLSLTDERSRWVRADPGMLRQILRHLLENAVKFTRTRVTVSARAYQDADRALWELLVADDGVGIAPESQAVIFERFRQVSRGTTRSHGGAGLGLAIVKRICELHGGTVEVTSKLGTGTTFTVRLPQR